MHGEKLTNGTTVSGPVGGASLTPAPPPTMTTPSPAAVHFTTGATLTTASANIGAAGGVTQVLGAAGNVLNVKDSRWLQLEVCREFQRGQCSRTDLECKFAHPPPHVEIQNGRVTACYDSIKGRCTRENPKCKYLHPPQHLKDQLLINGRNNLVLKNLLANQMTAQIATPLSISPLAAMPGTSALIPNIATAAYNPYATYALNAAALYPGFISASTDPYGIVNGFLPTANTAASAAMQKAASTAIKDSYTADRVEALSNSSINKRAAVEKGGMPFMQPIYQTVPTLGALPYQQFAVPGLSASYMVPASLAANPTALARF